MATSFVDDVYLSLVAIPDPGSDSVVVRVLIEPLVAWIWVGGFVIGFGTLLALVPSESGRGISREKEASRGLA